MKTDEEVKALEDKYRPRFAAPYSLRGIVKNTTPHPFMIGPKHIEHCNEHGLDGYGILGEETMRVVPCAWKGCTSDYEGHVTEIVALIRVPEKLTTKVPEDLHRMLVAIKDEAIADGIAGFGFLEPGR